MNTGFGLEEAVREARAKTGVPGVAAGLQVGGERSFAADGVLALDGESPVHVDSPFRIASISKPFTATLAAACLPLDARLRALLSHTAGLRCESAEPLPAGAEGLFSYSNAGFWEAGARSAAAFGSSFEEAMLEHVISPLALAATGYEEPPRSARGHVQAGEWGHRVVPVDSYPVSRHPSGGLWSTVGDLLRFGAHHLESGAELHEPQVAALGAHYALGWWVRELEDGTTALDHEGSVAGYQSLLLLVPERELVLAVLTNSWRGSGLIRRLVDSLGLRPAPLPAERVDSGIAGAYALDDVAARVEVAGDDLTLSLTELDPVTRSGITTRVAARPVGGGVYGYAGGRLMGHRFDFPRPDLARIGWIVLPRIES
jgi:CubicO group peptidase (beta-lactamase class C family)